MTDPKECIKGSIAHARKQYETPWWYRTTMDDVALRTKIDQAQPRLKQALNEYMDIACGVSFIAQIAGLHSPTGYRHECGGCDYEGYDGEAPEWPCRTAELIADGFTIDLSDMYLYRWSE